jgi:hypothetical protein
VAASNAGPGRSKKQIEADLDSARSRLTQGVEGLIDQVHPKRIKQRQVSNAKRFAAAELESAKSLVFNARGDLRTSRLLTVGGAIGGFVAFLLLLRTLIRRRRTT